MQNRCYSDRPSTSDWEVGHQLLHLEQSILSLYVHSQILVPCWGLRRVTACVCVRRLNHAPSVYTSSNSRMEAMFSTSLWRNQLSVLAPPFPPLVVGLHKSTGFQPIPADLPLKHTGPSKVTRFLPNPSSYTESTHPWSPTLSSTSLQVLSFSYPHHSLPKSALPENSLLLTKPRTLQFPLRKQWITPLCLHRLVALAIWGFAL